MKIIFSNRAYAGIMSETAEKIKTETGGLFLGVYDDDIWYVVESIDPGPDSVFEVAYFEYDQKYTQHLINKIANLYSARLDLIGLWHRHPGSLDIFSSTDDRTNAGYARRNPHGAISALVNIDPNFRLTIYHVASPCKYRQIEYSVGDELIPQKYLDLKTPEQYASLMHKRSNSAEITAIPKSAASLKNFVEMISPKLPEYRTDGKFAGTGENDQKIIEELLDQLMDDITFLTDEARVEMTVLARQGRIVFEQKNAGNITQICFGYDEKKEAVIFKYDEEYYNYTSGLFKKLSEKSSEEADQKEMDNIFNAKSAIKNIFNNWRNGKS